MTGFAFRLKKLRELQNLSQEDLAHVLGYSRSTIANYEQDIRFPSQETLCQIADYFNVSLDFLLGRSNIQNSIEGKLLDSSQEVLLVIDPKDGSIVNCSDYAAHYYGYKKEELLKLKLTDINTAPYRELSKKLNSAIEKQSEFYFKHRLANGQIRDVRVNTGPFTIGGKILLFSIIRDITHKKIKKEEYIIHNKLLLNTITTVLNIIYSPYKKHVKNVAHISCEIARIIGLEKKKIALINIASILHDIGKIYIPSGILDNPKDLVDYEKNIYQKHPLYGCMLLKRIGFDDIIANITYQHHERCDGNGYPNKLQDDQIMLEGKIVSLANYVDELLQNKPYGPVYDVNQVKEIMNKKKGNQFDKNITEICIDLLSRGFISSNYDT